MRTTVTLEEDVQRLLREAMHRDRKSFKETLNNAIRSGLGKPRVRNPKKFAVRARAMGLRAGYDPAGFNKLADDLEAEAFLQSHEAARRGPKK